MMVSWAHTPCSMCSDISEELAAFVFGVTVEFTWTLN